MNLDVKYDFVPSNIKFLKKMRLNFISKKDKIIKFIYKKLSELYEKRKLHAKTFENQYETWCKTVVKDTEDKQKKAKRERFSIWNKSDKRNTINSKEDQNDLDFNKNGVCALPKAIYNDYAEKFIYIHKECKRIENPYLYEMDYKCSDSWSRDDIKLFLEKYLLYPKDFQTISSYFYNKSISDIVSFYSNFKYHMSLHRHVEDLNKIVSGNSSRTLGDIKGPHIKLIIDAILRKINSSYYKLLEEYCQRQCKAKIERFTTFQLMQIFEQHSLIRQRAKSYEKTDIDYWVKPRTNPLFDEKINCIIPYYEEVEKNASRIEAQLLSKPKSKSKHIKKMIANTKNKYENIFNDINEREKKLPVTSNLPQRKIKDMKQNPDELKTLKSLDLALSNDEKELGRFIKTYLVSEKMLTNAIEERNLSQNSEDINNQMVCSQNLNCKTQELIDSAVAEGQIQSDGNEIIHPRNLDEFKSEDEIEMDMVNDDRILSNESDEDYNHNAKPKSNKKSKRKIISIWSVEEKQLVKDGLKKFGKDWEKIAETLPQKSCIQVKNFFMNYSKKLKLTSLIPGKRRGGRKKKSQSNLPNKSDSKFDESEDDDKDDQTEPKKTASSGHDSEQNSDKSCKSSSKDSQNDNVEEDEVI